MINFFKESETYDESHGLINDDKMTKKNFESSLALVAGWDDFQASIYDVNLCAE